MLSICLPAAYHAERQLDRKADRNWNYTINVIIESKLEKEILKQSTILLRTLIMKVKNNKLRGDNWTAQKVWEGRECITAILLEVVNAQC